MHRSLQTNKPSTNAQLQTHIQINVIDILSIRMKKEVSIKW